MADPNRNRKPISTGMVALGLTSEGDNVFTVTGAPQAGDNRQYRIGNPAYGDVARLNGLLRKYRATFNGKAVRTVAELQNAGDPAPVETVGNITPARHPSVNFLWGYQDDVSGVSYGSVSPDPTTYGGNQVKALTQNQSQTNRPVTLRIAGNHPQDYFTTLTLDDPDGGQTINSSSAATNYGYQSESDTTFWVFGDQSNNGVDWTGGGDAGEQVTFTITP